MKMVNKRISRGNMRFLLASIVILGALLLGYHDTFNYPFYFDDRSTIVENENIRDVLDFGKIWERNPARFFTFFSLAVNYHFGELNVFGYHLFNFLVHAINGLLVYWFATLLTSSRIGRLSLGSWSDTGEPVNLRFYFALIVAVLFVAHPIQSEAVTYVWQRTTSLVALFYILSMGLYLKSALVEERGGGSGEANLYFAGSVIFAIVAMFTKQNSITLPIAILLIDYFFISGSASRLKEKAVKLAFFIPVMMIVPLLTAMGKNEEISHIGMREANMLSPLGYLSTQFNVLIDYFKLILWPVGLNLDYDYPPALSIADWGLSFFILISLLGLSFFLFNRNRIASFGLIFYFLAISVESSFFPLEDLMFEHRVYLPVVGLFCAVVALAFQGAQRLGNGGIYGAVTLFGAICLALTLATYERNKVWQDEETLFLDVVSKSPGKLRGYNILGAVYSGKGDFEKARQWYLKALKLDPDSTYALFNYGLLLDNNGKPEEAIEKFDAVIKRNPESSATRFALGNIYMRKKIYAKAAFHYRLGLKIEGDRDVQSLSAYGTALTYSGRIDEALKVYRKVLAIEPDNQIAQQNIVALKKYKTEGK